MLFAAVSTRLAGLAPRRSKNFPRPTITPLPTEGEGFVREAAELSFVPPPKPVPQERGFVVLTRAPDDPGPDGQDFESDVPARGVS